VGHTAGTLRKPPDEAIARLKKLTAQLETAQKSARTTIVEIEHAKATTKQVEKDVVRQQRAAKKRKPKRALKATRSQSRER
jgi:hypothetical protein